MYDESDLRYLPALRNALLLLSLPAGLQLQNHTPGCVACDLLDEFELSCNDVLENLNLEPDQLKCLKELRKLMVEMQKADIECFNPEVLKRPAWQILREKSELALAIFGWKDARVEQFTEVEPGVWLRLNTEN